MCFAWLAVEHNVARLRPPRGTWLAFAVHRVAPGCLGAGDTTMTNPTDEILTLHEAADRLGVHYMTAYRYVRTGRLAAERSGARWMVNARDVTALVDRRSGGGVATPVAGMATDSHADGGAYAVRLESRLIRGDEAGAWGVVEEALGSSMGPEDVYTGVLAPAMASIGERWARGDLEIEKEHMASAIVQRLIGRLGPSFARRGLRRGTVVLSAPAGDDHGIPLLLVGDLLRSRGFEVVDLGANTPPSALSRVVAGVDRLVAVGVCATRPDNDEAISDAVTAVAGVTDVPVIVGGHGVDTRTEELLDGGFGHTVWTTHSTDEALGRFDDVSMTGR